MVTSKDDIPPWNRAHWERLTAPGAGISHGLLFHGLPGLGKSELAQAFAGHLLASDAGNPPQAAALFFGGNHPDMHVLMPETQAAAEPAGLLEQYAQRYPDPEPRKGRKPKRAITVGQVREALAAVFTRPYLSNRKVLLIESAHALNVNAANALLKVLEEPPPDTTLLLVTARPHLLPATVRSRLVRFEFRVPPAAQALDWMRTRLPAGADAALLLRLAHGAPALALGIAQGDALKQREQFFARLDELRNGALDPLALAASWHEAGQEATVRALTGLVADLARSAVSKHPPTLSHPDRSAWTAALAGSLDPIALFHFADRLTRSRRLADAPLDPLLQLEELAMALAGLLWRDVGAGSGASAAGCYNF